MKRLVICVLILFAFSVTGYAEMAGHEAHDMKHEMKKEEGQQQMMGPKMQGQGMMQGAGHQMPMMGKMMGHGMMMQDMMQMMTDILNIQEKIVAGVKASEKKQLLGNIRDMKAKIQNTMTMCKCMAGGMAGGDMKGSDMMCPMMGGGMSGHSAPGESKESGTDEKGAAPKTDAHGH